MLLVPRKTATSGTAKLRTQTIVRFNIML